MRTPWAAVVGSPVAASLSPSIFRGFSEILKRPIRYRAIEVAPADLAGSLARARELPWLGWNVTAPYKAAVIPLLDRLHPAAEAVGAVNVIHFQEGRSMGYNTDVAGFLAPLIRRGVDLEGRTAVVFGAGGAAAAVCEALRRSGAAKVFVAARTPAKATALASRFDAVPAGQDAGRVREAAGEADLLVNATSAGETALLPPGLRLRTDCWAYDLAYRPARTRFMAEAEAAGARSLGGLEMLTVQAALTWNIWFKETVPDRVVEKVREELRKVL